MAKITVKVTGGSPKEVTASTVGALKQQLGVPNHTALVNKVAASDDDSLSDDDFVTLAPAAKGA